ncbi:uncharacterized protein METZ01_LOCUS87282 [marine metagenome]|uniref:Uncharacterized protein n=1 Tax=marine metagenome TaxID=408172 RepID=A0A381V3S2_9ZZZZ
MALVKLVKKQITTVVVISDRGINPAQNIIR